jgi:hypothetical protein
MTHKIKIVHAETREFCVRHHHRVVTIGNVFLILSALLFAYEVLAPAGLTGILGVILNGLADAD